MNDEVCQYLASHIDLACKTYGYKQTILYYSATRRLVLHLCKDEREAFVDIQFENLLHLDSSLIITKLQERIEQAFNDAVKIINS